MDSKPINDPKRVFRILYNVDRKLYSILVFEIGYDPRKSLWIIVFWNWLEQTGFNVTQTFLSLPRNLISGLAEDALTCLQCIGDTQFLLSPAAREIVLTQRVLGKGLSLQYIHENREQAMCGVGKIFKEIYAKVLTDMMAMPPPNRNSEQQRQNEMVDQFGQLGGQSSVARPQRNEVPFEDRMRTMCVAFSSGFPVSEWEISEFITGAFGNCIESIQMQQPLYAHAHVVFFSPATINSILQGAQVAKFTVNGKDMWMSKYQHPPS
ncbi:PREDICTED: uncharacterized protein LOC109186570 [Ipomoea nil]|uniref:uncharacterized protein LOC109186570 n=1 Tax=Ipomoea nil TaxID=35883 RepID=UPI0009008A21|nr:PREDICTED: uncharacterized protein LOC109186570 [Ipomoea nil]XP_019192153.1 PREDICTED: uncharacterized protein LOC109186570 [Ipomoea nil]